MILSKNYFLFQGHEIHFQQGEVEKHVINL